MCKTLILSQREDVIVAQCHHCNVINIWRSGVLMNFSIEQFDAFFNATQQLNFDDYLDKKPNGQEVVILSTPFADLSLVFTREEWFLFFQVMDEANFMIKIYELVNGNP